MILDLKSAIEAADDMVKNLQFWSLFWQIAAVVNN